LVTFLFQPDTHVSVVGSQTGVAPEQSLEATHCTHSSPTGSHRGAPPAHCESIKQATHLPSFTSHSVS
jgi:hypothetical protein